MTMREYIALTILACLLVIAAATYVTNMIASSLDNVANTIASSTSNH
jgi:hypothetical protein